MTDPNIPAPRVPRPSAPSDIPAGFTAPRVATTRETPVERVVLFYLDDVPYSVPALVPANMIVAILNDAREYSEPVVIARMMARLLGGDQALRDLEQAEGLEDKQLEDILSVLRKMSMTATKRFTGKS